MMNYKFYIYIEVQDNNGNIYEIINEQISGNANTIAIKSAIQAHLILTEKLPDPLPPQTITNESGTNPRTVTEFTFYVAAGGHLAPI